ncbi:MAG: hypothetical protein Ct9H300mP25_10260 [Acidobacteriota bacterium]|nr:MAG: hypothetical protein Ct9H300mP25_10260 [Acidobacteriota bacterium]
MRFLSFAYSERGTQLLSVAFADTAPTPVGVTDLPGVDMVSIAGPFDGTVPTDTVSRQKIFPVTPPKERE